MTVTTLTISTCILWWILGFISGTVSVVVLGLHFNKKLNTKKADKNNESKGE